MDLRFWPLWLAMVAAAMADEGRLAAVAAKCTATLLSAHSGALKHIEGNGLAADERVKQDPAQGLGITAVAVPRLC